MLRTDDRALLTALLEVPDDGYRLERAVGTTFTMQLESLLRIPLAVAGFELAEETDPIGIMELVRSSVDRVDVFCQAGMLRVPSRPSPVMEFLAKSVHQVSRPNPGFLFHPKVWLASYTHAEQARRFRLVCGSRNLTEDRSWDAVVCLDGTETGRNRAVNRPLHDFVTSLSERAVNGIGKKRQTSISALAAAVLKAEWEPPADAAPGDWLKFHWIEGEGPPEALTAPATRRLVISPFLDRAGIDLVTGGASSSVVSRPESYGNLGEAGLSTLEERGSSLYELNDAVAVPSDDDEETELRWELLGLHAKVYVAERNKRAHVLIGSPNATTNAWKGNCEFAVEIVGKASGIGVRAALDQTSDNGFGRLLVPACPTDEPEDRTAELRRQLERNLVDVAAVGFTATVSAEPGGTWSVRLQSTKPLPTLSTTEPAVTVAPVGGPARSTVRGAQVDETWTGMSLDEVTAFFSVELVVGSGAGAVSVSCVVVAEVKNDPPERLDHVIANQVKDIDSFLRFVELMLQLGRGDTAAVAAAMQRSTFRGTSGGGGWSSNGSGLLETLVQVLAKQPDVVDDIDKLTQRLLATAEGTTKLPPGWTELWDAVRAARAGTGAK